MMILSNTGDELEVREAVAHRIKYFGFMPRCVDCARDCKLASGPGIEIECIEYPGRLWAEYRDKGGNEATKSEFVEAAYKAANESSAEGSNET